jgi:PHD/YefM family antitoxin component YafN of YafNO toxin-antitoxin module
MPALHPTFVVDHKDRKKAVIVPFAEWRRLMEAVEELEEIRAYDKAKTRPEEIVPFEEAVRQIKTKAKR